MPSNAPSPSWTQSAGPSTSQSITTSVTSSMTASSTLSAPPMMAGSYPGTRMHSAATTPRSSVSFQSKSTRGEKVALENVYKVIRVYSFWQTCTSFHRIVTMIDKVTPEPTFKKRLFVQYLWRNAKPYEKARVQREFDPRSQRILRFVTDTDNRKRVSEALISRTHLEPQFLL